MLIKVPAMPTIPQLWFNLFSVASLLSNAWRCNAVSQSVAKGALVDLMLDNWLSRNDVLPSGNSLLPANRSWSAWSSLTIIGQAGRERLVKRIIFFSVWFLQDLRTASHKNAKSDGFVGCGSRIGGGDLLLMLWANGWLRRTEKPPCCVDKDDDGGGGDLSPKLWGEGDGPSEKDPLPSWRTQLR